MKQDDKFTVINIREYLKKNADDEEQFGEDTLRQLLVMVTGEATGGTMQYALGAATEATESYTTSIPTATDAGT